MDTLFLVFAIFSVATGQILPGPTTFNDSVCYGDPISVLANCSAGSVIYVKNIQAGANLKSNRCPSSNNDSSDPCCTVKNDDCTFKLANSSYNDYFSICNGRQQCAQGGVQQDRTSEVKCNTSDYLNIYGEFTQYLYMDYYCVNSSRIHGMCTTASQTYKGQSAFLTNQLYPEDIPSGDTDCNCSVEVDDCEAKIQIYTLDMSLNQTNGVCGRQHLIVTDGNNTQNITCNDNNFQRIRLIQETSTNYINVRLLNTDGEPGGKFWLGFYTPNTSASMKINCPATPQTQVCTTSTSTTTTTTTTTTTSTTTTATTPPTTTTPTTTTSTTTSTTTPTPTTSTSRTTGQITFGSPSQTTDDPEDHTTIGFIIGLIVLGIVIILLATCLLVYCLYSRKKIQKLDIEIANLREHSSESKEAGSAQSQVLQTEYATMSKDPPNVCVDYTAVEKDSERNSNDHLKRTENDNTCNGDMFRVTDEYAGIRFKSKQANDKQFSLLKDVATTVTNPPNEIANNTMNINHNQAVPITGLKRDMVDISFEALEQPIKHSETHSERTEIEQTDVKEEPIGKKMIEINVNAGAEKGTSTTIQTDNCDDEHKRKRKKEHGKDNTRSKFKQTGNRKVNNTQLQTNDLKQQEPLKEQSEKNERTKVADTQLLSSTTDLQQQQLPKEEVKQKSKLNIQQPDKTENSRLSESKMNTNQQERLTDDNKQQSFAGNESAQLNFTATERQQMPTVRHKRHRKKHKKWSEDKIHLSTHNQASTAEKSQNRQQLNNESKESHIFKPEEQQHQPRLAEKEQDIPIPDLDEEGVNNSLCTDAFDDKWEDCVSEDENATGITAENIEVENQKLAEGKPVKSAETKRYFRVFRLLSSALGYSWTYKEVWRRKKHRQLKADITDCMEDTDAEHVPNITEPNRKSNITEGNSNITAPSKSSKAIPSVKNTKTDETPNENGTQLLTTLMGGSRVHPYHTHRFPVTRKGKTIYKHKTHWTDSKF